MADKWSDSMMGWIGPWAGAHAGIGDFFRDPNYAHWDGVRYTPAGGSPVHYLDAKDLKGQDLSNPSTWQSVLSGSMGGPSVPTGVNTKPKPLAQGQDPRSQKTQAGAGSSGLNPSGAPSMDDLMAAGITDRNEMQRLANEQYDRRNATIDDYSAALDKSFEDRTKRVTEESQTLNKDIDSLYGKSKTLADEALKSAKRNEQKAEAEQRKFTAETDRTLKERERQFDRAASRADDAIAAMIQNRRLGLEQSYQTAKRNLEAQQQATGRPMTADLQRLSAMHTQQMGSVVSDAYEKAVTIGSGIEQTKNSVMASSETQAAALKQASLSGLEAIRASTVQTTLGVSSFLAGLDSSRQQAKAQVAMWKEASLAAAEQMKVNGLETISGMVASNAPVYIPWLGILSQLFSMNAAAQAAANAPGASAPGMPGLPNAAGASPDASGGQGGPEGPVGTDWTKVPKWGTYDEFYGPEGPPPEQQEAA